MAVKTETDYERDMREFDEWWEEWTARREREKNEFHEKALAHLAAGGVVRELGMGSNYATDWVIERRPEYDTDQPGPGYRTVERLAEHLTARRGMVDDHEFLPRETPPWRRPLPAGAMWIEDLVAAAKARGFHYVATMDGPLALEKWRPYGDPYRYFGELHEERIIDATDPTNAASPPFLLGGWVLLKELPVG